MAKKTDDKDEATAPLRNMALFNELIQRVVGRASHLPGMACFYGPSGYGKTFSATWATSKATGIYVEMGESWTRRTLVAALLKAVGVHQRGPLPDMMEMLADALAETPNRPVLIDEADYLVSKNMIDVVREIHDKSHTPVILLGEELLPVKLQKHERTHNRMLDWVAAVPCDIQDTRHLARIYAPGCEIADDLLAAILKASDGRARRIAVNLYRVREKADLKGRNTLSLAEWSEPFFTGEPPRRRAA